MIRYSIVATTYNDEKNIYSLLNDLIKQTLRPSEIVIADGGSTDKTVQIIEEYRKKTNIPILVLSDGRLNIAEGYNLAIENVSFDFVGIAGIGNNYNADYYEKLANQIEKKKLDGAYSPIRGKDSNWFSTLYNRIFLDGKKGQRLEIASNHGVLMKKSIFEDLGYFYTKFYYAGEDTEFYSLVKNKGYKLEIVEDAIMYWETPDNISSFAKQVRVYTIGGLQIDPEKEYAIAKKNIVKLFCAFLIFIGIISLLVFDFSALIKVIGLVIILIIILKKRFMNILMLMRSYFQIKTCYKDKQYSNQEYRVRRVIK